MILLNLKKIQLKNTLFFWYEFKMCKKYSIFKYMDNQNHINLAVILGSGLDNIMELIDSKELISSDNSGLHKKRNYLAEINNKKVLFFCGRSHFYEGIDYEKILENIAKINELKIKNLIITNAAGGINPNFNVSDLMLINSHINFNQKFINKRSLYFPYNHDLMERFKKSCNKLKVPYHEGIYGCIHGPAYETKAEIRMLKTYGVDAIGMSTIPEVLNGITTGISILGLSVITNLLKENISISAQHENIVKTAKKASENLFIAIKNILIELN
jgi:purine-nucleoside phosphorylase